MRLGTMVDSVVPERKSREKSPSETNEATLDTSSCTVVTAELPMASNEVSPGNSLEISKDETQSSSTMTTAVHIADGGSDSCSSAELPHQRLDKVEDGPYSISSDTEPKQFLVDSSSADDSARHSRDENPDTEGRLRDNRAMLHQASHSDSFAASEAPSSVCVAYQGLPPVSGGAVRDVFGPSTSSDDHPLSSLPRFADPQSCMWTSSHAANAPSEDRSSSLVNVVLRPAAENNGLDVHSLIRLNLWAVIDGHGGGSVATYASEVLLPHIAANVSRALECEIVHRGDCTVNGQLRDANAFDLDGLIRTPDKVSEFPKSIHYRSPRGERDGEEDEADGDRREDDTVAHVTSQASGDLDESVSSVEAEVSIASSILPRDDTLQSVSSAKTSVKTAASPDVPGTLVGTHAPSEVARVTSAITESFLAVDEGWINSIDPASTRQTSCQTNGRWNAGACALVVFTVQRLDWTRSPAVDHAKVGAASTGGQDTSHNRDAARRRMLDYASKGKSVSSLSTISSSSSLKSAADAVAGESAFEFTETEDDYESDAKSRKKRASRFSLTESRQEHVPTSAPVGSHVYQPHEAMLYTAHVGDCRAVMLGAAPPRTIKVPPDGKMMDHTETTDDESSCHSSDETECLSSSDHDAASSDEEDYGESAVAVSTPSYLNYMRRPARRPCRRRASHDGDSHAPFVALPPLKRDTSGSSEESGTEVDASRQGKGKQSESIPVTGSNTSESAAQDSQAQPSILHLSPIMRPIDLTTDHSAYNPAEVSAVLRRCNNAPKAISAGVGGGIKRVAGSLAVTRALGDAYLKTPELSFSPYKRHAPYITARPEVNCRLIMKESDRVLVLATDGVWERANGDDVLRWIRNYTKERLAEIERRSNKRFKAAGGDVADDKTMHERESTGFRAQLDETICSVVSSVRKRKRSGSRPYQSTAADVIVRRVLNKVRRARNMPSLQSLMSLPKGRARRSKHDDITASVVDMSAFVS